MINTLLKAFTAFALLSTICEFALANEPAKEEVMWKVDAFDGSGFFASEIGALPAKKTRARKGGPAIEPGIELCLAEYGGMFTKPKYHVLSAIEKIEPAFDRATTSEKKYTSYSNWYAPLKVILKTGATFTTRPTDTSQYPTLAPWRACDLGNPSAQPPVVQRAYAVDVMQRGVIDIVTKGIHGMKRATPEEIAAIRVKLDEKRASLKASSERFAASVQAEEDRWKAETRTLRPSLKPGDETDKGMVIEVKKPLALIQLKDDKTKQSWVKINHLYPAWEPQHIFSRIVP